MPTLLDAWMCASLRALWKPASRSTTARQAAISADEGTPDPIGEPGTREGVQQRRPYEIAWQLDGRTRNSERPREPPENCDEGDQGYNGAHSANSETQGTGDKLRHILSNTLVGVVS